MSVIVSFTKPATAVAVILCLTSWANAEEERYDRAIEAAAIAKAAEKMGGLRTAISHEKQPVLVSRKDVLDAIKRQQSLLPKKIWKAPKPENSLPPMVSKPTPLASNALNELDYTFTATINGKPVKIENGVTWEKFDADGNPID